MKAHWEWQLDELNGLLQFHEEKYLKRNVETFVELPERHIIEAVYLRFHKTLDEPATVGINLNVAIRVVARLFVENDLPQKYLKRWAGSKARALFQEMKGIYLEEQKRFPALGQADS